MTEEDLRHWGHRIGEELASPSVLALSGPLGAGKSVLARAIGAGMGVREVMPSPTYTLVQRYAGTARHLVHLDLYRIESPEDLWELGWAQLPGEDEVVVIEWPEKAGSHLPSDHWHVKLTVPEKLPDLRDIEVVRVGDPPELPPFPEAPRP
jgi:tRNA threonylcarbamoyladenosine biosynthesis protein TsaE